ncbi:hypothetical protein SERLA73DRAFT_176457 [Serpula lacrymans var. lacrymans S7.3]|uniref:Uncharacterized protein n=2 Tax=Serpula lacrymans var. lacrymans TaxID=341189 RepID=F8PMY6_SERL3|nr:uncharacterized protein SERLADRAFT_459322 [Serpula lacrymans var. lacrymans S7.9]EGO02968.1 hypothetical protein SERLA73DRAFT_176457 [Serpula lacrymans var. lacrymans S7.3]EGO28651.1 hypothetical protein SERLADRAFT_459322 [Serpula lacrymans var. lacrymans S7.9]
MSSKSLLSSAVVTTLFARTPPPPLSASRVWRPELSDQIDALDADVNTRAVLHLLNDDFDGCHELAQTQEGNPYSNHLHAIVHRREPDYWNSKYWIARCSHPHMKEIYATPNSKVNTISQAQRSASTFVDLVENAARTGKGVEELEKRQWAEMTALAKILIEANGQ